MKFFNKLKYFSRSASISLTCLHHICKHVTTFSVSSAAIKPVCNANHECTEVCAKWLVFQIDRYLRVVMCFIQQLQPNLARLESKIFLSFQIQVLLNNTNTQRQPSTSNYLYVIDMMKTISFKIMNLETFSAGCALWHI